MALIRSVGLSRSAAMPSRARACGDSGMLFSWRDQTPPPAEISFVS